MMGFLTSLDDNRILMLLFSVVWGVSVVGVSGRRAVFSLWKNTELANGGDECHAKLGGAAEQLW